MSNKKSQKKILIIGIILAVLVSTIVIIVVLIHKKQNTFEGTIDCQPPLVTEYEIDLCRRAKEAGYPNIVY